MTDASLLPYRPCAGIMLLNAERKVFVGQRLDSSLDAWQMPQGGVDEGEATETAAYRELEEETGISKPAVNLLARASRELTYDLPAELVGKLWKGRYRGQRQSWFLMEFTGTDQDVNIETAHQEFRAWQWLDPSRLPTIIVPFKQKLYRDVLNEFSEYL